MPFTVTSPQIDQIIANYAQSPELVATKLNQAINKATIAMQTLIRNEAPHRTGKLRSSVQFLVQGLRGIIYTNLNYAVYVEYGTGIWGVGPGAKKQPIVPVNKKVLATKINPGWGSANSGGYFIIGKSSQGQHPNPFFQRGEDQAHAIIDPIMIAAKTDIIDGLKV